MPTRLLILGGSSEASQLAAALAGRRDLHPLLSLAGVTRTPRPQPIEVRHGGFGGVEGLISFLRRWGASGLIDATHPFAARMSMNAASAAEVTGLPLLRFTRAAWLPGQGDDWHSVGDLAAAAAALGPKPRRVFLTTGRQGIEAFEAAPLHHYLIRAVDPPARRPALSDQTWLLDRGPFQLDGELDILRHHRIDILVTKNSGGEAAAAKLVAARLLRVPVIMIDRPRLPPVPCRHVIDDVLDWIARLPHGAAS
ncbi:precorrin-6A/cobalt-precorrin-6A reductase [Arboricoccus pini]|uniref:Precorrin-6A/cobalt-precorrin-6A reductase n=1 Tax=Arboricoccus pini TaxID=1963835 RepID=A0A212RNJ0_9PROT|nr:cobalt-precorrin-6A reductase [Arboricoccus pini]SNB74111.1 precorrin-6A/cobalt-precorrin-6A reductase [Arboricoccus pini]